MTHTQPHSRDARPESKESGFTLIELSIVLVIIGLIVGGVLTGQTLIKGAKVRSALTQITKLNVAVNAFHDRYGQLPGDISNYASIGMQDPKCTGNPTCQTSNATVEDVGGKGVLFNGEVAAFMADLATAGMTADVTTTAIKAYTAGSGASPTGTLIDSPYGTNFYVWLATGQGTKATNLPTSNTTKNFYHLAYINTGITSGDAIVDGVGMTPVEAAALDSKLDDGVPNVGQVQANNSKSGDMDLDDNNGCVVKTTPNIYDTAVNANKASCSIVIQANF